MITAQLRWSYGVRLLAQADEEPVPPITVLAPEDTDEHTLLIAADCQATLSPPRPHPRRKDSVFHSFPNTPVISTVNLAGSASTLGSAMSSPPSTSSSDSDSDSDGDEEDGVLPAHRRHPTAPTSSRFQSALRRARHRVRRGWATFNEFMTVPLWAAILSLVVACIRPLQHVLEEHAQPIKGSLASAGNCSIPVTLVVLGAYFYTPPEAGADKKKAGKRVRWSVQGVKELLKRGEGRKVEVRPGETKTVIIAILSRMVLVPLLLMPLMALSTIYDWQAVFEE